VPTTYHLVPRRTWDASGDPYAPGSLASEGFVHCTDGAEEVAATANRYFGAQQDDLLALVIDLERVAAPVRYEDPRRVYPHVYGPIPRAAIVEVLALPRDGSGAFLPPQS
jgi:uncharacterized protein (DUF952 family)